MFPLNYRYHNELNQISNTFKSDVSSLLNNAQVDDDAVVKLLKGYNDALFKAIDDICANIIVLNNNRKN